MKKILLISLTLSLLILVKNDSFAQHQNTNQNIKSIINVSPFIIDTQLNKGENKYKIQIKNLLNEGLGISASPADFSPESQTTNPNKLVDWTEIKTKEIILNPGETKQIDFVINVPKNAKDGGFSEYIFLTPIYIKAQNPNAPTVLSRIGVLVLANLGKVNYNDLAKKTGIEDFKFSHLFYEKLPATANFSVKNNYFAHFSAKPILTLTPLFGKSEEIIFQDKHVLPGQSRSWSQILNPKARSIFYTAKLAVSVGQGKQIFANTFFFVLPIRAIMIILGLVLIVILVLFRRKQIKKAIQVLFKGT